jgi:hypothetical protein
VKAGSETSRNRGEQATAVEQWPHQLNPHARRTLGRSAFGCGNSPEVHALELMASAHARLAPKNASQTSQACLLSISWLL